MSGKEGSLVPLEPEKIFLISKIAVIFELRSAHTLLKQKGTAVYPQPIHLPCGCSDEFNDITTECESL